MLLSIQDKAKFAALIIFTDLRFYAFKTL